MSLEEMLRSERERAVPNPLAARTDALVTRVRRRRRARAAVGGATVAGTVALAVLASGLVPWDWLRTSPAPVAGTPTDDAVRLLSEVEAGREIEPGRYAFSVVDGPFGPLVPVVSVPDGYEVIDGGTGVGSGDLEAGPAGEPPGGWLWLWSITRVYPDPCDPTQLPAAVVPSPEAFADALAAQAGRGSPAPVAVSIGGYDGHFVELTVPPGVDPADCPSERYLLWPGRWQEAPGQVDRIWILDVDGRVVVLDASYGEAADPGFAQELTDMATSVTFVPADDL